jgi:hypothetical protein
VTGFSNNNTLTIEGSLLLSRLMKTAVAVKWYCVWLQTVRTVWKYMTRAACSVSGSQGAVSGSHGDEYEDSLVRCWQRVVW